MNADEGHLHLGSRLSVPLAQIELSAVRSQGAGGQNVNKTATAIHLRFDLARSGLPAEMHARLRERRDRRLTREGVIVIKAQRHRSQELNRADALERLRALLQSALEAPTPRTPTRVPKSQRRARTDDKTRRGRVKALRGSAVGVD